MEKPRHGAFNVLIRVGQHIKGKSKTVSVFSSPRPPILAWSPEGSPSHSESVFSRCKDHSRLACCILAVASLIPTCPQPFQNTSSAIQEQ